ncbi:MAG: T9SS type A sorting domain-containing protein, partial [Candidatus Cloacimonetes bacterium]|nr:T9SS type A sorting domain-containing protein [Candidatus Cloacimonadota bacterium]
YYENINFNGKGIVLTSEKGAESTVINGNQNGDIVVFNHFEDSTAVLSGFTITEEEGNSGNGISCYDKSNPTLSNLNITKISKGSGIYCVLANPSLINVTISENSTYIGAGICCYYSSSPSLINVTITNNKASENGGGIYCDYDSSPSLTNVTITNNIASGNGGGIYCGEGECSPILTDVTISGNTAENGGGIYSLSNSNLSLKNVAINENTAIRTNNGGDGGGLYCRLANPILTEVTISRNIASRGGGIYCANISSLNFENLTFAGNKANYYGAGIYISDCNANMDNINFEENESGGSGGDIYLNNAIVQLTNSRLYRGHAFSYGGGIYCIGDSKLDLLNVWVELCIASFYGGLYATNAEINISNCLFTDNDGETGGALGVLDSKLNINNSLFYNNTCYESGTLLLDGSHCVIFNSVIHNNSAQETNGGISGGADIHIINSIICGNTEPQMSDDITANYSLVQGGWPGVGNIDADPLFVNSAEGDYHLKDNSSCIGSGIDEITIDNVSYFAPEFDLDGNPRPNPVGSLPDMGAFENPFDKAQMETTDNNLPNIDHQLCNYPNPFNPETTISFNIADGQVGSLEIFNVRGQKIVSKDFIAGSHTYTWKADSYSSGIYFYQLTTDKKSINKKMILMK